MGTITCTGAERTHDHASQQLLERDRELVALEQCLWEARAGFGSVVFIEAQAGGGKSRLLGVAADLAREERMRILTAAGAELEREFPFGLARTLFEPAALEVEEADELLNRPLALAASMLDEAYEGTTDADPRHYSVIHGLYQATQNLVDLRSGDEEGEGLAILVDDLQWADRPSLRFLAYLAERTRELPIAIVLSAVPGLPSADPQAVATLRRTADGRLFRLAPLGADAVAEVVRARFPQAQAEHCAVCAQVSGGNPFLLGELLSAIGDDERAVTAARASSIEEIVPVAVRNSVEARLESMAPTTRAVAEAIAVLGRAASVRRVAIVAELDSESVLTAASELAESQLLASESLLSFAQPMLGTAIKSSVAPSERAQAHLRAARILAEQKADSELIAEHLLEAPAVDDPAAAAVLREAAEAAVRRAEPERAIRLLGRALAEHPPQALRSELLAELALAHGQALHAQGEFRAAADALHAGLAELDDEADLAGQLRAAYIEAAALVGELGTEALEARDRLIADQAEGLPPYARAAIAHTLVLDGLQGAPRASVRELAELAWGDGALLQSRDRAAFSVPLVAIGLVMADDLELALEICDAALDSGGDDALPAAHELIAFARAWALFEQGRITEAQAAANTALEGVPSRGQGHSQSALALLARCAIERGDLAQAESVLAAIECHGSPDSVRRALLLDVRAQLRLAQHRPQDALEDALHAGAVLSEQLPDASPGWIAWRSTAALAHLALGAPEEARKLVEHELEQARNIGVTRIVVRDLRILGLAQGGKRAGIDQLGEAVAIGGSHSSRLQHFRALIDYGAALRRANRRADAREPLRLGLDLSHRAGASVLESRARAELIATGARPRRPLLTGIESLTASQLRVARLAADGLTTRQIAGTLFVTPKTVEFHLRQIYLKLDVASRGDLARKLSASSAAAI